MDNRVSEVYYVSPSDDFLPAERAILDQVNERVAAGPDLDEVMSFVFEHTSSICPCDRIGLAFLEEDDQRLTSQWAKARYEPILLGKGYSEDIRHSSLEQIIHSGSVRVINDLERYFNAHPQSASTRLILKEGVRSSMTCPLSVDGRIVGVMFRSSRRPDAYDDHQVALHFAIASRLSQAVEKAWRISRLEAANHAYIEMLGFVSHELKSPLASITTDLYLFEQGYLGPLSEKQQDKVKSLIRRNDYLISLIKEYLDLARIESGGLTPNFQPAQDFIQTVVENAVSITRPLIDQAKMKLAMNFSSPEIKADFDPDMMNIVLVNLLSNAAKYGCENGRIDLAVEADEQEIVVSVRNEGPGFPPEQKSRLFKKFSRLNVPELLKKKGTGVGLYTTWKIINVHHGKIKADSQPGSWAEFGFTIPRFQARLP